MKASIVEEKEGLLVVEFDDKILPNALLTVLLENKVDAYTYEPHPLLPAYRLRIEADDPMKELRAAVKAVETDWNAFGKELMSKIKPSTKKPKKK